MTAKAAELQREVRENADDYQNYLKDLYEWEKEIKVKDEMLKNAPKNIAHGQVLYNTFLLLYYMHFFFAASVLYYGIKSKVIFE